MSETLPLTEIKAHLSEIVDRVEREHERVILTRNGRPAAVILSPDDLEALEDTPSSYSQTLKPSPRFRLHPTTGPRSGGHSRGVALQVPASVSPPSYPVVVTATDECALGRLLDGVAAAVVEFMLGALIESPRRVGHPLRHELTGPWAARRGPYRVIYEIDDDDEQLVKVLRIDHRADEYRPR